jgi:hypothetical protein
LESKGINGEALFRQQLACVAIPGLDQSQQKVLIPDVSMTKLVSFGFCQNQRLAGCLTQRQVVRQQVWLAPREVGVDRLTDLFFGNPIRSPADIRDGSFSRANRTCSGSISSDPNLSASCFARTIVRIAGSTYLINMPIGGSPSSPSVRRKAASRLGCRFFWRLLEQLRIDRWIELQSCILRRT